MQVLGIAGWSGSGKTTLVERLIPALIARGLSVSTVKHAHHAFDVDRPGKDSWRHRAAGAHEVVVASAARLALMQELRGATEPELPEIVARLKPVDLVLVEGFKRQPIAKLEVHRAVVGKPLLHPEDPWIVAVASDAPLPGCTLPQLPLDRPEAIADFIVARLFAAPAPRAAEQAPGDCFAHADGDLSVAEAAALIASRVEPVCAPEPAPRPLAAALGGVLAADLIAQRTVPAQDNSAVDGYALRHAELATGAPTRLAVGGRAAAGRPLEGSAGPGSAVRIFTGAALPPGCDTVVMQEDVHRDGDSVIVPAGIVRDAHRRPAGEDCRAGTVALAAGARLGPRQVALAAASGAT
ncbi:molybdopterin-guanine dinucleotide biosynthesis protein B, partial [Desertibaculum subflavum]|uniref:molybdopterin-guanine dinucleotide biosynthesis protein B n=1 Tax=Desertibaculum subflavum TaxID=2268458 RepID=UPI000E65FAF4